jgi:hypothetical protein
MQALFLTVATLGAGQFEWRASEPLIQAQDRDGDHYLSIKDPSVVRYGGRWHVFCTIRGQRRSHQVEYLSFVDWSQANRAQRETLRISDAYFCAPQVFYFAPQRKWYLIYQAVDKSRTPALQPAFSTTTDIGKPGSWSKPTLLIRDAAKGIKGWIDFWVVCDQRRAHLFFTTLNGEMWRADTSLAEFPDRWSQPRVVLKDDIYEASHTYSLKGRNKFLTVVEAQSPREGRRYYKAYLADRLDGEWTPLAARAENAFAAPENVKFPSARWTDSFSHGELIRDGYDQRLVVNPDKLEFLFQGVLDQDRKGKPYGEIPWRLGILKALGKPLSK